MLDLVNPSGAAGRLFRYAGDVPVSCGLYPRQAKACHVTWHWRPTIAPVSFRQASKVMERRMRRRNSLYTTAMDRILKRVLAEFVV